MAGTAVGAEIVAVSEARHLRQNRAVGRLPMPQVGHRVSRSCAQASQNNESSGFSCPQAEQRSIQGVTRVSVEDRQDNVCLLDDHEALVQAKIWSVIREEQAHDQAIGEFSCAEWFSHCGCVVVLGVLVTWLLTLCCSGLPPRFALDRNDALPRSTSPVGRAKPRACRSQPADKDLSATTRRRSQDDLTGLNSLHSCHTREVTSCSPSFRHKKSLR